MIVGTAGHIDHGKTALLQALTGQQGDRRRESASVASPSTSATSTPTSVKAAPPVLSTYRATSVSCTTCWPAPAASTACCWWSPLTTASCRRPANTAIVELLGIRRALVALTKIDRVEPARIAEVQQQIEDLLAAGPLAGAPTFRFPASAAMASTPCAPRLSTKPRAPPPAAKAATSAWPSTAPSASPAQAWWSPAPPLPGARESATNCCSAPPANAYASAACTRRTGSGRSPRRPARGPESCRRAAGSGADPSRRLAAAPTAALTDPTHRRRLPAAARRSPRTQALDARARAPRRP